MLKGAVAAGCAALATLALLGGGNRADAGRAAVHDTGRSGWQLRGTVTGVGVPKAIYEHPAQGERVLTPGDELAGCRLLEVAPQGVHVQCGSQRRFQRFDADAAVSKAGGDPQPVIRLVSLSTRWVRAQFGDLQELAGNIAFAPEAGPQGLRGYRVTRIRKGGPLEGLGLEIGDLVVAVNGAPASQPDAFADTIRDLGDSPRITLSLERQRRPLELDFLLHAP